MINYEMFDMFILNCCKESNTSIRFEILVEAIRQWLPIERRNELTRTDVYDYLQSMGFFDLEVNGNLLDEPCLEKAPPGQIYVRNCTIPGTQREMVSS